MSCWTRRIDAKDAKSIKPCGQGCRPHQGDGGEVAEQCTNGTQWGEGQHCCCSSQQPKGETVTVMIAIITLSIAVAKELQNMILARRTCDFGMCPTSGIASTTQGMSSI